MTRYRYDVELVGTWKRPDTSVRELNDYFTVLDRELVDVGLDIEVTYDHRPPTTEEVDDFQLQNPNEWGDRPPQDPTAFGDVVVRGTTYARNGAQAIYLLRERFDIALMEASFCENPEIKWS